MPPPILLGQSDFERLRLQGGLYVDKSELVSSVLSSSAQVQLYVSEQSERSVEMLWAGNRCCDLETMRMWAGAAIQGQCDSGQEASVKIRERGTGASLQGQCECGREASVKRTERGALCWQGRARLRGPALKSLACVPFPGCACGVVFTFARHAQASGKVVPGKSDHPAQPPGTELRSKVVFACAKRLASVFGHNALLRTFGAYGLRFFAAQCFWLASPVSSGPGPTDTGYANKGAGLALARRKVGQTRMIGNAGTLGYPILGLPELSGITEYLRHSHLRPIGLQASAALACKRPFCNASAA